MSPTTLARRILAGGLEVSCVGAGCWAIGGPAQNLGLPMGWSTADDEASLDGLRAAWSMGVNLFDTADVYGLGHSERLLGAFLREVPREQVVLCSKVGYFSGTAAHGYQPSHMRRQLETTLENLGTDRLDIYFFHNSNFGEDDRYLDGAIEQMQRFKAEGLIGCIGMRGPHRFATERLAPGAKEDKHQRFLRHFEAIRPDFLSVRYNALTPPVRDGQDIFAFTAERGVSVLINKPLAQGLLTGKYWPGQPAAFGEGDHRLRKRWFTAEALPILDEGLAPLRERFGPASRHLVRAALGYCLQPANAAVLVGFTHPAQVIENLTAATEPLNAQDVQFIQKAGAALQQRLDEAGEVFVDEA